VFGKPGEDRLEIVLDPGINDLNRQAQRVTRLLKPAGLKLRKWIGVVDKGSNDLCSRDYAVQKLQFLWFELDAERDHTGDVAAWSVQAVDQTERHRIAPGQEHDGNRFGECFGCNGPGNLASLHDHTDRAANQSGSHSRYPISLLLCPAIFDNDIAPLDVATFAQALTEAAEPASVLTGRCAAEEADQRH
jgi:hypothetical protein